MYVHVNIKFTTIISTDGLSWHISLINLIVPIYKLQFKICMHEDFLERLAVEILLKFLD
jgi:hypothetical protein